MICFSLLQGLASRHEVALLAFTDLYASELSKARKALAPLCAEFHPVQLPSPSRVQRLGWRIRQWLGGVPVDAAGFDCAAMHQALKAAMARFAPDVVVLQFPYMAQYAADVSGVPVVMDVQDVFFVSRLREYAAQRARWARAKRLVAWLAWMRYEMRWYARCDLLMALSDQDRAALHALVPDVPSFTNMAAITARAPDAGGPADGLRVGFAGNFNHPPNLDALSWLSDDIAPRLARACPGVQIVVAGRGIPESFQAGLHPAIRLLGFVEDFDGFVRSCAVFLVPLRFGGGVKIKVLEALACGRPVVTTAIGAEGIPLGAEQGLIVAASAEQLVDITVRHLAAPAAGLAAAAIGATALAAQFGVEGKVRQFELEVGRLLAARHARRSIGQAALRAPEQR